MFAAIVVLLFLIVLFGDALFVIIPIAIILLLVAFIYYQNKSNKREQKLGEDLAAIKDFTPTQTYKLEESSIWFSIDEVNKKVAVVEETAIRVYNNAQILGVELLKDDVLIASKSTSRTLGGAVVGGVLAGGAGMVVGGLSGKEKIKKGPSNISLNLIVKDIKESTICLLKNIPEDWPGSKLLYKGEEVEIKSFIPIIDLAQDLKNTISVIIDQVDREQNGAKDTEIEGISGADELLKYHGLLEKGVITTSEFDEIKRKILSK